MKCAICGQPINGPLEPTEVFIENNTPYTVVKYKCITCGFVKPLVMEGRWRKFEDIDL